MFLRWNDVKCLKTLLLAIIRICRIDAESLLVMDSFVLKPLENKETCLSSSSFPNGGRVIHVTQNRYIHLICEEMTPLNCTGPEITELSPLLSMGNEYADPFSDFLSGRTVPSAYYLHINQPIWQYLGVLRPVACMFCMHCKTYQCMFW